MRCCRGQSGHDREDSSVMTPDTSYTQRGDNPGTWGCAPSDQKVPDRQGTPPWLLETEVTIFLGTT